MKDKQIEVENSYEESQHRIKDLKRMSTEMDMDIKEKLRTINALTADINSRLEVIEENREEIIKLEEKISLLGADYR